MCKYFIYKQPKFIHAITFIIQFICKFFIFFHFTISYFSTRTFIMQERQ